MRKLFSMTVTASLLIVAQLSGQANPDTTIYHSSGVLVDGDGERQELRIRHEEMKGYMRAMTMVFKVQDWDALPGDLYVGDSVTFDLVVLKRDAYVENVDIVKPNALVPRFDPTSKILDLGETFPIGHFTDSYGNDFELGNDARGLRFISFIYTRCPLPTMCPLVDQKHSTMADLYAKEKVSADELMFVSISFDYIYDTPAVLKEHYGWRLKPAGNWAILSSVGHEDDLRDVTSAAGVDYWGIEDDDVSHTMNSVLIDGSGKVLAIFSGTDWAIQDARDTIGQALASSK